MAILQRVLGICCYEIDKLITLSVKVLYPIDLGLVLLLNIKYNDLKIETPNYLPYLHIQLLC